MQPWHALFAPLPPGAVPCRRPVLSLELAQSEHAAVVAGWDSLVLDLSDPPHGSRTVHVLVDGSDRPISASDHVLFRFPGEVPAGQPVRMRQESVGGRLEGDGTFNGTHWDVSGPEPEDDEEPLWESRQRPPTVDEIAALKRLVEQVLKRAPARSVQG